MSVKELPMGNRNFKPPRAKVKCPRVISFKSNSCKQMCSPATYGDNFRLDQRPMLTHPFRTVSLEAYSSADHLMKKVMSNLSASTADLMRIIYIIQDSL